jgi:hypothetical protein
MQASHTGAGVDLAGIALAAGFPAALTMTTAEQLSHWLPVLLTGPGPVLGVVKVAATQPPLTVPARDGAFIKNRFREALLGPKAVM